MVGTVMIREYRLAACLRASSVVVHIESGGSNIIFLLFSISVL